MNEQAAEPVQRYLDNIAPKQVVETMQRRQFEV